MTTTINVNNEEITIHAVTSDTHVSHKNIAVYAGRPYDNSHSTSHMDEDLIAKWNEVVREGDNVLTLGDMALGKIEDSLPKFKRMNGTKFLVPGNHDRICSLESAARRERFTALYEDAGFIILDETIEIMVNGVSILASHYPYPGTETYFSGADKYAKVRPVDDGRLLLHGHTHSPNITSVDFPRQYHVGADAHDLYPVKIDVIENWVAKNS